MATPHVRSTEHDAAARMNSLSSGVIAFSDDPQRPLDELVHWARLMIVMKQTLGSRVPIAGWQCASHPATQAIGGQNLWCLREIEAC
jgi:hypothetical protein